MSIVGIYFVLAAFIFAGVAGSIALGRSRGVTSWTVAILVCFAVCAVWQEVALRMFAAREPRGMNGLILRPVPFGGGDHELAPRAAHYVKFSFVVPGITAVAAALLVSLLAVAIRPKAAAGPVAVAAIAGAVGYALLAIARLLAASDIFI